ncbi:hypothetical protein P872_23715 [Rhodonellum psychrophilum GCM71 = DSM 17998]|uniref:Uncharacterized protein n=2 Tax=Rhodonellum TaxID=336827 RepID=U5C6Y4_9BACT|nr:hypothetical protein P872_23715 [Rhodonellum psychrophilum GCM71 = DSM 17998]SDZ12675.1 hypothetical protein SAMN05444412_10689 [Rhodonellum ikkaensis]
MAKGIIIWFLFLPVFLTGKSNPLGVGVRNENPLSELKEQNKELGIFSPDQFCLYFGSVIGDFFGGGNPDTDVYSWKILKPDGSLLVEKVGGFQTFSHTFSILGEYEVQLKVRRGLEEVFSGHKNFQVVKGADLLLESSYLLCDDGNAVLTLFDPKIPFLDKYVIEWKNSNGEVLGKANSIVVNKADVYSVYFYSLDGEGELTCPYTANTLVYYPEDYSLQISKTEECDGGTVILVTSNKNVSGNWYYQKEGDSEMKFLNEGSQLSFSSSGDLEGPGNYQIVFKLDNQDKIYCKTQESISYKVLPSVEFSMSLEKGSGNCADDDGVLLLTAWSDMDIVQILGTDIVLNDLKMGQTYPIPNLKAGVYHARGRLGNCSKVRAAIVPLLEPPESIKFNIVEIRGEACNDIGKIPGLIRIKMAQMGFMGDYRVLNTGGVEIASGSIVATEQEFEISIGPGNYYLEVVEEDGCKNPYIERFEVPSKEQIAFSAPQRFTVCESFEYTPEVDGLEDLSFTLTYPDGKKVHKIQGEPFVLDQAGKYFLLGVDMDGNRGFCPRVLSFEVVLTAPITYEPELVFQDCFGNKAFSANLSGTDPSKVVIKWYNEKDEIVGNGILLFPTSHGEFKLDVQPLNSQSCPYPPRIFQVEKADLEEELSLSATPFCPSEKKSVISLEAEFDIIHLVKWIYYDNQGASIELSEFQELREILVEKQGVYEVVVFNKGNCELGRTTIEIKESVDLVEFDVPEELFVCKAYAFTPVTLQDLVFTMVLPDGQTLVRGKDEAFLIDQQGEYVLSATSSDLSKNTCPTTKIFKVKVNPPVEYDVVFVEQDCSGKSVYRAELFGADPDSLIINWYNSDGSVIGNAALISLTSHGDFSLEVYPKGSFSCPDPPISFFVEEPIVNLDLKIVTNTLCPGAEFSLLTLETDQNRVFRIEWYFTDFRGNKSPIHPANPMEIFAKEEGTYEVVIFSEKGCVLAKDQILLMRSMDAVRPSVKEEYTVCFENNIGERIDPGLFKIYNWYFEGSLIATYPTFKPTAAGKYSLVVSSKENCEYSVDFYAVEECEFRLVFPNAIKLGDPDRHFLIYANGDVEELEIWVFDKWGGLIFHCKNDNILSKSSGCHWDGTRNGERIPPGVYSVKLFYKRTGMGAGTDFATVLVLE